jgi:hypothetical protein
MHPTLLDINYLLTELDKSFYTMPLMIVFIVLFLVVAVRYRAPKKTYRFFILYGILFLVENTGGIIMLLFDKVLIKNNTFTSTLGNYSVLCFLQIEFLIFYTFFYYQFSQKHIQHKIAVTGKGCSLAVVLLTAYAGIFPFPLTIKSLTAYISVFNSVLILIPAFYYFYTLFIEPPTKNLLHEPTFWITTGIAFLHGLNIPLFFIETYAIKQFIVVWYSIYSINYIAYCVLFILLIISLLCKRPYNNRQSLQHVPRLN